MFEDILKFNMAWLGFNTRMPKVVDMSLMQVIVWLPTTLGHVDIVDYYDYVILIVM